MCLRVYVTPNRYSAVSMKDTCERAYHGAKARCESSELRLRDVLLDP